MRWNLEVDFRTIKTTLKMGVLRCKSQPMVDKEIAVYFLAYTLVRRPMAALLADVSPRALSFTDGRQLISPPAGFSGYTPQESCNATRI